MVVSIGWKYVNLYNYRHLMEWLWWNWWYFSIWLQKKWSNWLTEN